MARTPSAMKELGTKAPNFMLKDSFGDTHDLAKENSKPLLLMFICNHCPFVKHIFSELVKLGNEYQEKGYAVYAINSNDYISYPEDNPEHMIKEIKERNMQFPYLIDEDQNVAKQYSATCTPDFFVYDANHTLIYRGQFDSSRPGNQEEVNGKDLRTALDLWLNNKSILSEQKPSLGCNIKWKQGNEPI